VSLENANTVLSPISTVKIGSFVPWLDCKVECVCCILTIKIKREKLKVLSQEFLNSDAP
jgi:hypothetical protein